MYFIIGYIPLSIYLRTLTNKSFMDVHELNSALKIEKYINNIKRCCKLKSSFFLKKYFLILQAFEKKLPKRLCLKYTFFGSKFNLCSPGSHLEKSICVLHIFVALYKKS